jgi:hypothetical protein
MKMPAKKPALKMATAFILCATALQLICWKPATISEKSRYSWATGGCRQQTHSTASQKNFNNKTFRIIHPFHPYKDTEFEIDQVRNVAVERRVFFFNQKGRKSSVPLDWTDIGPQDLFVVLSAGRALFRVEDLLGLVRLVGEIDSAKRK